MIPELYWYYTGYLFVLHIGEFSDKLSLTVSKYIHIRLRCYAGHRLLSSSLNPTDRDPHQALYFLMAGDPLFVGLKTLTVFLEK